MGSKVKTGPLAYFSRFEYLFIFCFGFVWYLWWFLFVYFKRGLLSKKWKEGYFCLYEDSTIQWFEKPKEKKPEGTIRVREVAQYLSVGPFTRCVPGRPSLPSKGDENLLICIPKDMNRKEKDILWIICRDLTQLK